jgi:DNA-binding NarL/FixJ family response regulator
MPGNNGADVAIFREDPRIRTQAERPSLRCLYMKVAAQRPTHNGAGPASPISVLAIVEDASLRRRVADVIREPGIELTSEHAAPDALAGVALGPASILVFVCDVDVPREIASLRRLHREAPEAPIVVVSPPTTGTGVRRALDAGADALAFEPELDLTLAATVRAVASGQTVVPRKLRAGIERPNLSHRERQVLTLVRSGLTNAEIAKQLYLAESTIKSHLSSIFTKFGVRSRQEAAAVNLDGADAVIPAATNGASGHATQ